MNELTTEITLSAPAGRLWELVTDVDLYPHWNPLFKKGAGRLAVGEGLELLVELPEIPPFTITPRVMELDPHRAFSWRYTMGHSVLFSWRYAVEFDADGSGGTTFVQRSVFGGILAPLFRVALRGAVEKALAAMNRAMRRWGEKGNVTCLKC